jgi:hypothetical protein
MSNKNLKVEVESFWRRTGLASEGCLFLSGVAKGAMFVPSGKRKLRTNYTLEWRDRRPHNTSSLYRELGMEIST